MNVTGFASDSESTWTSPYPPARFGATFRLLRGDAMRPDLSNVTMRPGREGEAPNWFNCIPVGVCRRVVWYRPFMALRVGRFGVYVGWKVYGVDSEAYYDYPSVRQTDVYVGSRALAGSLRFTTSL